MRFKIQTFTTTVQQKKSNDIHSNVEAILWCIHTKISLISRLS